MAYYLVRANLKQEFIAELHNRIEQGEFRFMKPFGSALTRSLRGARWDPEKGEAVWEEEDYCAPPLAMERAAVLERYFEGIRVEPVGQGEGWERISSLPSLWKQANQK